MARAPRAVTTVLFTDIVGSTERAAELGDRGWVELARILQARGDRAGAIEAYDFAATAWREAEPEYEPKLRGSLARLVGAED